MHKDILKFIKKQTSATISCIDDSLKPYSFTVFYAWDEDSHQLIYKSSPETNHSKILTHNIFVSGTIHPDKLNKLLVQGIQFEGMMVNTKGPGVKMLSASFTKNTRLHW